MVSIQAQGHRRARKSAKKRATKLVPELRHLPYAERVKRMSLTTLEIRTERRPYTTVQDKSRI
jgi:hypothetical protein